MCPNVMVVTLVVLALSLLPYTAHAQPVGEAERDGLARISPFIAGIPYTEAKAIFERHEAELSVLPDVEGVRLCLEGICVATENAAVLPKTVEGLPVKVLVPMRPPTVAGRLYRQALAVFDRHKAELIQLPGVEQLSLGQEGINVVTDQPDALPKEVEGIPLVPRPSMKGISRDGS